MDNRDQVKAFLSSRRAKITPERAGLHSYNRNRRVPGLRRSEVADPYDKALTDLVGELCTRSDEFRVRWAAHDVADETAEWSAPSAVRRAGAGPAPGCGRRGAG